MRYSAAWNPTATTSPNLATSTSPSSSRTFLSTDAFAEHFRAEGYEVIVCFAQVKESHPWDVRIVKHMVPTHAAITDFEEELQNFATPFGGLNDGWGCFSQLGEHLQ